MEKDDPGVPFSNAYAYDSDLGNSVFASLDWMKEDESNLASTAFYSKSCYDLWAERIYYSFVCSRLSGWPTETSYDETGPDGFLSSIGLAASFSYSTFFTSWTLAGEGFGAGGASIIPSLIYSFWLKFSSSISNFFPFGSWCWTNTLGSTAGGGASLSLFSPSKWASLNSYSPLVTSISF